METNLLTYKEAARILGCSDKTVWSLCKSGQLKAVRFGGNVRIDPRDLDEFVQRAKTAQPVTKKPSPGISGGAIPVTQPQPDNRQGCQPNVLSRFS